MKYNFDEIIDRTHDEGSYSSKWGETEHMKDMFYSDTLPEDRICFFLADMEFKTAPCIIDEMQKILNHGIIGYSSVPRAHFEAVARWMKVRFNWEINPDHVLLYSGAHTAIIDCIEKMTKPGDGIIIPQPTYYYRQDVTGTGRHYVGLRMKNDNGYYTFDFDKLEEVCKDPGNTMLIMQQPHNPTGRVWTIEELQKIGEICAKYNVIILSDEVHMDIKRKEVTVEPLMKVLGTKNIVTVTGINKTFNLAGLAVTNVIIEDNEIREKIGRNSNHCTPFGYAACIAAYNQGDDWVDELNDYLDDTIDYAIERIHNELPKAKVWKPEGTYILWIDFAGYGLTEDELNDKLAKQAHLAMSNGEGMDEDEGEMFRRMCITMPKSMVKEGIDRMVKVLENK